MRTILFALVLVFPAVAPAQGLFRIGAACVDASGREILEPAALGDHRCVDSGTPAARWAQAPLTTANGPDSLKDLPIRIRSLAPTLQTQPPRDLTSTGQQP